MERDCFIRDAGRQVRQARPAAVPTVLLADDDDELLELFAAAFEDAGFSVVRASDGCALENAYANAQPDAIVTDMLLPGQSGAAAIRRIRAAGFKGPVFLMSGLPLEPDQAGCLGSSEYLRKPVRTGELVSRVRLRLKQGSPASGA